jgi:hypothetical protein
VPWTVLDSRCFLKKHILFQFGAKLTKSEHRKGHFFKYLNMCLSFKGTMSQDEYFFEGPETFGTVLFE